MSIHGYVHGSGIGAIPGYGSPAMIVPSGGFAKKLDEMYEWHRARGIQDHRGRSRRDENGRDHISWCFADPSSAEAFGV
jgi:hypothetical protein